MLPRHQTLANDDASEVSPMLDDMPHDDGKNDTVLD
jgi:hypothetical protein